LPCHWAILRPGIGEIILGNHYVRVLHTPGHSLDSVSLVLGDRVPADDAWLVFPGDTRF
jgi:glyoxylase-like metal-dependent hydrolase (beta-lactamase superfamily II)